MLFKHMLLSFLDWLILGKSPYDDNGSPMSEANLKELIALTMRNYGRDKFPPDAEVVVFDRVMQAKPETTGAQVQAATDAMQALCQS